MYHSTNTAPPPSLHTPPNPASTHPLPHTHKTPVQVSATLVPKPVCGRGLKRADLDVALSNFTKPHWISSPNLTGFRHKMSLDFVTKPHWISSTNLTGFRHKSSLDFVTKPHWISPQNLAGFLHKTSLDFSTKHHWISPQNLTGFRHKTSLDFPLHSFWQVAASRTPSIDLRHLSSNRKCHT